jgi:hypothetical protein
MERKLEVDVHTHWNTTPPVYRLYVNNELFTERTFKWVSYQYFIREHINCKLDEGVHVLRLENLQPECRFELDAFRVNNNIVNTNSMEISGSKIEWKFAC